MAETCISCLYINKHEKSSRSLGTRTWSQPGLSKDFVDISENGDTHYTDIRQKDALG